MYIKTKLIVAALYLLTNSLTWAVGSGLFKVGDETISQQEIYKEYQNEFYSIEKEYYKLVNNIAKKYYLKKFFKDLSQTSNLTSEDAERQYLEPRIKASESEIVSELLRFQYHPKIVNLSEIDKRKKIIKYIKSYKKKNVLENIINKGIDNKKLVILVPKPLLPIYHLTKKDTDPVRYGPLGSENEKSCKNNCLITVVEFFEFECPYCKAVQPTINRILKEYQGKIQWIARDFPIYVHKNAKPAAIAARCAKKQGKYWDMYHKLFNHQYALSYTDFFQYAKELNLNLIQFEKCLNFPNKIEKEIQANYKSGVNLKISGTPAFFINGRKYSGALSYHRFKSIIENEIFKKSHRPSSNTEVADIVVSGPSLKEERKAPNATESLNTNETPAKEDSGKLTTPSGTP